MVSDTHIVLFLSTLRCVDFSIVVPVGVPRVAQHAGEGRRALLERILQKRTRVLAAGSDRSWVAANRPFGGAV